MGTAQWFRHLLSFFSTLGVVQKLRWQDFFWPPTYPELTFVKEFLYCYREKSAHRWYFQDNLPTSSCQSSLWTSPTQSVLRNGITIFGCFPKILRENNICDLFCRIVRRGGGGGSGSGAPNLKPKIHTCFGPMGPSMNRKMLSSKIIFQFETKL